MTPELAASMLSSLAVGQIIFWSMPGGLYYAIYAGPAAIH